PNSSLQLLFEVDRRPDAERRLGPGGIPPHSEISQELPARNTLPCLDLPDRPQRPHRSLSQVPPRTRFPPGNASPCLSGGFGAGGAGSSPFATRAPAAAAGKERNFASQPLSRTEV